MHNCVLTIVSNLNCLPRTANADFVPNAQNATLPVSENSSTVCVSFDILDDRLALEGEEQLGVRLNLLTVSSDVRLEVGMQEATIVISDDDSELDGECF